MAVHFFLLLSSLMTTIAIILVLYSFNIAIVLAMPFISDSSSSQSEKIQSFWTMGADMPTPRTDFTGATLNGSVYIIGGFDSKGSTKDTVEFYNPKTNTWDTPLHYPIH
jgi:hypothetical protein